MIRATLALSAVFACSSAFAVDLNGIELQQQVSPVQLKERFNVEVIPQPGSAAAMRACSSLMGNPRKYEQCINRTPNNTVPIAAGEYDGQFALWGHDTDCQVKIDDSGRVVKIVVTFSTAFFPQFADEAMKKWGKPTATGSTLVLEKANGASAASTDYDWDFPDGSSVSIASNHNITQGRLVLKAP